MKNYKRIIALLLALITALMIPVCCFAEEAATADVAEEPAPRRTGKVATLYLNVSNANPKYPHCWLYFVNETDEPIQVGYYTVPAGDSVSVGNFRDRGNGSGIYYNLERYWVKEATYGRTFSMSTSVSAGELRVASALMKHMNHWDWVFNNCSGFATTIWNICSPRKILHIGFPQVTRVEMILWGARRMNYTCDKLYNASRVYKQVDDGLQVVYPSVVYTKTGV